MEKLLIINFGSQYSQLIVKQIQSLNVHVEIVDESDIEFVNINDYKALIISGGPSSVNLIDIEKWSFLKSLNKPILGICFGMQLIAHLFNGCVKTLKSGQYGEELIKVINTDSLIETNMNNSQVWMSHFDEVITLNAEFKITSKANGVISSFSNEEKKIFAMQFHPEVSHTTLGLKMIKNFVFNVAKMQKVDVKNDQIEEMINKIRKQVGNKKVVLGLSGGVDSTVCAKVLEKAIGSKLTCIFVNHGLMRKNEQNEVFEMFKNSQMNIRFVDYAQPTFDALKGVVDPEEKRKNIGKKFIEAFNREIFNIKDVEFLAQGTIFSDKIESSQDGAKTHLIKSHHNVGGLPQEMNLKLVEPLKMLFKDEVRNLGIKLGINPQFIWRHPFPGPGLGIRIIGEVTKQKVEILQNADYILINQLKKLGIYNQVAQAAAILTNTNSVGIGGDERTFEKVLAIRIVDSSNFMTANFSRIDINTLAQISKEITNYEKRINRVVYDITNKPPATIEWE